MLTHNILAMAGQTQPAQGSPESAFGFLIPFILIFVVFYFLIIRPQQKERKKHQELLDGLKSGDRVVTSGGILGTIHSISDKTVQLKVADKVKITILRSSIRGLQGENLQE